MKIWFLITFSIILGLFAGFFTNLIFKYLPEKWLQDYGVTPNDPNYRPSKRMKLIPHGLIAMLFCVVFYVCSVIFCQRYFDSVQVIRVINIVLLAPTLVLITMSDRLNRIIPDQFSIVIGLMGILAGVSDYIDGNLWFTSNAKWYVPLLSRVIAAIVGGGFLWLIGFVSETFLGKEAMGQGDMKLLAAIGLLTGCYGMVVVIYAAVFSSLLFAIPLVIRKNIRIKKEEEYVRNSPDPVKARKELRLKKSRMHFADDPDYLAFGPFLALGAGVFIAAEPFWFEKMLDYMEMLGVYF